MFRPSPALAARGFALALAFVAAPVPARELFWRSIDVVAKIQADGTLAVAETQAMVMSGDWNGGERIFRVEPAQKVRVVRIVRLDPATGAGRVLQKGDLSQVDHWDWAGSSTVRWRSRAPDAPAFEKALLVYRLEFVYDRPFEIAGDGTYRLAHDFAFADREGPIERFSLELDAAPGWQLHGVLVGEGGVRRGALPARFEAGPLPPQTSYIVGGALRWSGAAPPALAAVKRLNPGWRVAALVCVAAAALYWGVAWWRRDAALGRFAPLPAPGAIDAAWLEEKVFSVRPEVVGAAWDREIGDAEVAAMLARFVAEGRLASAMRRVGGALFGHDVLELELRAPRESFDADEKKLIDGLFPAGDRTDTDSLRAHYRSTGFNPVSRIRAQLDKRVRTLAGFDSKAPRPGKRLPSLLLVVAGALVLAVTPWLSPASQGAFMALPLALVASIPGFVGALRGRSRLGVPVAALVTIAISTACLLGVVAYSISASIGAALVAAGLLRGMFRGVATRESSGSMARRGELLAARRLFAEELSRETPRLEDRWFPWLIALGLARDCDRWSKRFRVATAGASSRGWSSSGGSATSVPSSGATSGWSGGGGSFGGAGASAGFALAATSLAAGVPSPSSGGSSGGGSGGGGGSSSGGGGGGGW